ncbi:MAG: hypothetical protein WC437_04205 [Patescibacteria group bacterium]
MEELDFNNIKLDDADKKVFDEIKRLTEANSIGEALQCINHTIKNYLHKALLAVGNIQDGMSDVPEEQKKDFVKITRNLLKASLVAKELRKFYHL